MTRSAGPALKKLHREFGDRVAFVTVYVREAHPGDRYPQAQTLEQKRRHALEYQRRDEIPWPVVVDDLEGGFHQAMDAKPNAAYLVDPQGFVVSRVLWSNDERVLRRGLRELADGRRRDMGERTPRMIPMLAGVGAMEEVLAGAGEAARRDLRREAPPIYFMARVAALFRRLSPLGRGVTAAAVVLGGTLALLALLVWAVAALAR